MAAGRGGNMIDIIIEKGMDGALNSYKIREKVFIEEQGVSPEIEKDEYDKEAVFSNLYEEGVIKATARYIIKDGECLIGRVAVLKEERGRGFGEGVMSVLIDEIFANNIYEIYIHSQTHAAKFYEGLGFKKTGDEYMEAGIPHVTMKLTKKR